MTANPNPQLADAIQRIARDVLGLDTLETRRSDRLDYHEHAVWQIRAALEAAYRAGAEAADGAGQVAYPTRRQGRSSERRRPGQS